jgi:hypothetical protein
VDPNRNGEPSQVVAGRVAVPVDVEVRPPGLEDEPVVGVAVAVVVRAVADLDVGGEVGRIGVVAVEVVRGGAGGGRVAGRDREPERVALAVAVRVGPVRHERDRVVDEAVAVVVRAVAELDVAGEVQRVGVVAVGAGVDPVAVEVRPVRGREGAVLVHAVAHELGRARVDAGVAVVAVGAIRDGPRGGAGAGGRGRAGVAEAVAVGVVVPGPHEETVVDPGVAVVVPAVAHLHPARGVGRVGVVAVETDGHTVAVEVRGVGRRRVAVVVAAVAGELGRARVHGRVGVVAVVAVADGERVRRPVAGGRGRRDGVAVPVAVEVRPPVGERQPVVGDEVAVVVPAVADHSPRTARSAGIDQDPSAAPVGSAVPLATTSVAAVPESCGLTDQE